MPSQLMMMGIGGGNIVAPANLVGIVDWWSARGSVQTVNSDGTGGTPGDGAAVGRVTGSVNGNNLIQATTGSKPAYAASGPTSVPAWTLGGDDFWTCDGVAAQFAGADKPFTVIACAREAAFSASEAICSLGANIATQPFHFAGSNGVGWHGNRRGDTGAGVAITAQSIYSQTVTSVIGSRFFGTEADFWKNRQQIVARAAQDVPDCSFTQFTVGCLRRDANSFFWTGSLLDLILCAGALSDAQLIGAMNFLAAQDNVS